MFLCFSRRSGPTHPFVFVLRRFEFGIWLGLFLPFLTEIASASPFYDYKIVDKPDDTIVGFPIQTLKQLVSINDNGWVAFVAESAIAAKAVFLAEPGDSMNEKMEIA